jgi:hypothetical protein
LNAKLYQRIAQRDMRVWGSDGGDRDVGLTASSTFSGLGFHAWDEAHSSQRVAVNSLTEDEEIIKTDLLLVTGKGSKGH